MDTTERQIRLRAEAENPTDQPYFDKELRRAAEERRTASREKRLAEKLRLAKMAGNKGG